MPAPSVLLVDDGELDALHALLERLHVDVLRASATDPGQALERPRDLLLSSGPRALEMPALEGDEQPLWVCVYDPDYLVLREPLCAAGVHYLVSSELAPQAMELFLRQVLHTGEERRRIRRLPQHCEVALRVRGARSKAVLLELSRESCVMITDDAIEEGRRVEFTLPADLTGDDPLELVGAVLRSTAPESGEGATTVFRLIELSTTQMARVHDLLAGEGLTTPVTPLADDPAAFALSEDADAEGNEVPGEGATDRRSTPRHSWDQRVDAISWYGAPAPPRIALGRDLSMEGLRIAGSPLSIVGDEASLALYPNESRKEPLLLQARVVRIEGDEAGLRFEELTPRQRAELERILAATPAVEPLDGDGGSLHLVELR